MNYSYSQIVGKISSLSTYALMGGLITTILLIIDILATLDSLHVLDKLLGRHYEDDFENSSTTPLVDQ